MNFSTAELMLWLERWLRWKTKPECPADYSHHWIMAICFLLQRTLHFLFFLLQVCAEKLPVCMFVTRSFAAVHARNASAGCLYLFQPCGHMWGPFGSVAAFLWQRFYLPDTSWGHTGVCPNPADSSHNYWYTDIMTETVCASKPFIFRPGGRTRTYTRTPWGHGPNVLSAAEIDTAEKRPHFHKPLRAVTGAAVTNCERQKEELIRSDFLSYKSGVTTRRTPVWAVHVSSEHQLCSLNGRRWELMTSRRIKLYQNRKCLQIEGWITGSCIRNPPLPPPARPPHYH